MSTTNILDMNNRIEELEKNSGGGGTADSAKRSDIATEFNTTTAYTAGCYVYHEGKLYQFNTDHAAGDWDPTDVVEANVTDQIVSNKSAIDGLTASDVAYDNTDSGLTATDVQGAVDELAQSYPAEKVMLSDGVTSVEDALDGLSDFIVDNIKVEQTESILSAGLANNVGTGIDFTWTIPQGYRPLMLIYGGNNQTRGIFASKSSVALGKTDTTGNLVVFNCSVSISASITFSAYIIFVKETTP